MTGLLKTNRRLALIVAGLIGSGALGYSAARARGEGTHGHADRQQLAAIAAERDRARADLAAAEKKLHTMRRTIRRYAEELAYVDELNAALRRGEVVDTAP